MFDFVSVLGCQFSNWFCSKNFIRHNFSLKHSLHNFVASLHALVLFMIFNLIWVTILFLSFYFPFILRQHSVIWITSILKGQFVIIKPFSPRFLWDFHINQVWSLSIFYSYLIYHISCKRHSFLCLQLQKVSPVSPIIY